MTDTVLTKTEKSPIPATVHIEDIGPCRKRVTVEIDKAYVSDRVRKHFETFRDKFPFPGFRLGKAPLHLIDKKFGKELRREVKGQMLIEAFEQNDEIKKLRTLGQPKLDPDAVELKDDSPLTFKFETEVRPSFELPNYNGLKLRRPNDQITDDNIERALLGLRKQHGQFGPPPDDATVEDEDMIDADIEISCAGRQVFSGTDQQIIVEEDSVRLQDIPLDDLPAKLAGAKLDDTREFDVVVHDQHPEEELRGKTAHITITIRGHKRIIPADIEDVLKATEASSLDELKGRLLNDLERKYEQFVNSFLRSQVRSFLLENVKLSIPTELAVNYASQLIRRKTIELMRQGVPRDEITSHAAELEQEAVSQAASDLAELFILDEIAEKENIQISPDEVNGEIARMAAIYKVRFDRMRNELMEKGGLDELVSRMREARVYGLILSRAQFEDITLTEDSTEFGAAPQKQSSDTTTPAGEISALQASASTAEHSATPTR